MLLGRILKVTLISVVVIAVVGEICIRSIGLIYFPIYDVDSGIGYIPKANQSGVFLRKNRWVFNDRHMPIDAMWNPKLNQNILVIGNSIVMGGNPYNQEDKLVPIMEKLLGDTLSLWPCAAGGWTNVNEIEYLRRNPEVIYSAKAFLWEYMQGGLSQLATWQGDYTFPSRTPIWATEYIVGRYVMPHLYASSSIHELPPSGVVAPKFVARFDSMLSRLETQGHQMTGIIWLYPTESQLKMAMSGIEWLPERQEILKIAAAHQLQVIDLTRFSRWTDKLYRDGVHPTLKGNQILASILTTELSRLLASRSSNF